MNNQFYLISNHSTSSYSRDNYVDFQPLTLSIGEYLSIKSLILTDAIAEYSKDWSTPIYLQLLAYAIKPVVDNPPQTSSTRSPGSVVDITQIKGTSRGKRALWER